jgi:hypothetical protein
MADARKVVSYDGIDVETVTMKIDGVTIVYDKTQPGGAVGVGRAVSLVGGTSDDMVELAADNGVIYGKLLDVQADGFCTVQVGGYADLPGGNGATLTITGKIQGALNAASARGFIKIVPETVSASPTQAEIQALWRAAKTRGTIVNNDVTTAVWVDLNR